MRRVITAALVAALLVLVAALAMSDAARGNSGGLPQQFNAYRASLGLSPLRELQVLDTSAQSDSDIACATGGYHLTTPPLSGSWTIWQVYGYTDVAQMAAVEEADAQVGPVIRNPNNNAIGVGVNTSCPTFGYLWTIIIGHATVLPTGVPPTTPPSTRTATPTPSGSRSPTPISTGTTRPTATITATPTTTITGTPSVCVGPTAVTFAGSIICFCKDASGQLTTCFLCFRCAVPPTAPPPPVPTPTATATQRPTSTPAPTIVPTPTPYVQLFGDVDCDGVVGPRDAQMILKYVLGLPVEQAPGCPVIGSPQ
jgi:hypothetical protein